MEALAGEAISALRVVYLAAGEVFHLDAGSEHVRSVLGVTATAGALGAPVNVQRLGVMTDTAWSWTPGPVWCGAGGQLTQTPPVGGYDLQIGAATDATTIILNIQEPIELE